MTSASNPPAILDTGRIDAVAERIATDWGHHGHRTLVAMIAELYTDLAVLPTHYTPHHSAAIITDAADTTASELSTLLDDHIQHEADRPPVTEHGWVMHADDRHHALTAALATRTADHLTWWLIDQLNDYFADREAEHLD